MEWGMQNDGTQLKGVTCMSLESQSRGENENGTKVLPKETMLERFLHLWKCTNPWILKAQEVHAG